MALLFARVQLNGNPSREQYDSLHAKMAQLGFSNQIRTVNGLWELPHATYPGTNYVDADQASNAIKRVADAVVANSHVLVTSGSEWQGHGLVKIR